MNSTAVVFFVGFAPALALGWVIGTVNERAKHVSTSTTPKKYLTRDNLLIALVIVALVGAVVAAVYAYGGNAEGKTRDDKNLACLQSYVSTGQKRNAPATLANRAQSAAFRDYERGYSTDPDAKNMNKAELKARYLTLYAVYEAVQVSPLPDLRIFCAERK